MYACLITVAVIVHSLFNGLNINKRYTNWSFTSYIQCKQNIKLTATLEKAIMRDNTYKCHKYSKSNVYFEEEFNLSFS